LKPVAAVEGCVAHLFKLVFQSFDKGSESKQSDLDASEILQMDIFHKAEEMAMQREILVDEAITALETTIQRLKPAQQQLEDITRQFSACLEVFLAFQDNIPSDLKGL
jgi:hypothetical protein